MRATIAGGTATSAVAVSDVFLDLTFMVGLLIGPAVAAAFGTVGATVAVGVYSIVAAPTVVRVSGHGWGGEEAARYILLLAGTGVITGTAWVQARRREVMEELEAVAEAAQLTLLRPLPPFLGHTALAARYVSASSKAIVGGDLYEAAYTPQGVRVVIGDARGKGLAGVEMAAVVLGAFRELAYSATSLSQLARTLDVAVGRHAGREDFVTALLVEIRGQLLTLANCGHPPALHCTPDGIRRLEPRPALPLGLGARPVSMSFGHLEWGERLLLYTDGLIEARSPQGKLFDLDPAAHEALYEDEIERGLDRLVEHVQEHTGGPVQDDIAVMLVEMVESPPPPTVDDDLG